MHNKTLKALVLVGASAASAAAMAHTGVDGHTHLSFMSGFLHPFTGMDHLIAMLSIGLWSALVAKQFGREMLWGPLGFAAVLLVGAVLGLMGVAIPAVEPMIAVSLVGAGLLVLTRLPLRGVGAAALAGAFALFHGLAHGYELAGSASAVSVLAGMVSATLVLHVMGLAMGWSLRGANVWVPRALGAGVAVVGGALLFM